MKIVVFLCFILFSYIRSDKNNRDWSSHVLCNETTVYSKGKSTNDTLHLLVAANNYTKTISAFMMSSYDKSDVSIDCDAFQNLDPNFFQFSGKILSSYGLVFQNFIENNTTYSWKDFNWHLKKYDRNFTFFGKYEYNENITANYTILLSDREDFSPPLPSLKFSGNNTVIHITASNMTNLTIGFFSDHMEDFNNKHNHSSLDDEKSPGVFVTKNLVENNTNILEQVYIQWKPVFYSDSKTNLNTLKDMELNKFHNKPFDNSTSLVELYFKNRTHYVQLYIANFKTLQERHYVDWCVSFGIGKPLVPEISLTIILIIALGLGLPFVLVIVGSIVLFIRRRNMSTEGYGSIN